jgi:hypothetical protein
MSMLENSTSHQDKLMAFIQEYLLQLRLALSMLENISSK